MFSFNPDYLRAVTEDRQARLHRARRSHALWVTERHRRFQRRQHR